MNQSAQLEEDATPSERNHLAWSQTRPSLVLAGLSVLLMAQLWSSMSRVSQTSDEADHLHAGYRYLQCGDYGFNPEHPPLAKLVAAAPLLGMTIRDPFPGICSAARDSGVDFRAGQAFVDANGVRVLSRARIATSLFAFALILTVWYLAMRMFGAPAAMVAGVLLVFDPNLLAHGSLVTTDVAVSFGVVLSVLAFYCYTRNRGLVYLLLTGLGAGISLATKFSGILVVPILLILALTSALFPEQGSKLRAAGRNLPAVVLALALGILFLWGTYGFRYSARPPGAEFADAALQSPRHSYTTQVALPALIRSRVLPEAYLVGLHEVLTESENGRPVFILGNIYPTGQWFYFPLVLLIKTPLPLLLALVIACFAKPFWSAHRLELAFLLIPAGVFLAFSMRSGLNLGVRHILPVTMFLVLFAAAGLSFIASWARWGKYVLAAIFVLQTATSLASFPKHISYANEAWGGPSNTYKWLSDSNVDWGQGLYAARDYVNSHVQGPCWMLYAYPLDTRNYGIRCPDLQKADQPVPDQMTGTFIVGAQILSGTSKDEKGIDFGQPFRAKDPVARLGGSAMLVYKGTFDMRVPASLVQQRLTLFLLTNQRAEEAVVHARESVRLTPESGMAHFTVCTALVAQGSGAARPECIQALELLERHPEYNQYSINGVKQFMRNAGMVP